MRFNYVESPLSNGDFHFKIVGMYFCSRKKEKRYVI